MPQERCKGLGLNEEHLSRQPRSSCCWCLCPSDRFLHHVLSCASPKPLHMDSRGTKHTWVGLAQFKGLNSIWKSSIPRLSVLKLGGCCLLNKRKKREEAGPVDFGACRDAIHNVLQANNAPKYGHQGTIRKAGSCQCKVTHGHQ